MNIRGIEFEIVQASMIGYPDIVSDIDTFVAVDEVVVRNAMANALEKAQKKGATSIAFPALGIGRFPAAGSAKIMAQGVWRYARETENPSIRKITFVIADPQTLDVFTQKVPSYLHHIMNVLCGGPFVTVDGIIEYKSGIVLIERSNPPFGWALPGGFLDYGESAEEAVAREVKEETNLEFTEYRQFHTYSAYGRDPRFQTVTIVFTGVGSGMLQSGDDAQNAKVFKFDQLPQRMAFDHRDIVETYYRSKREGL